MQREEERPPAPLDWDKHKDEILELYVSQNKKLPDVKKHMSLTHNFKASERQYKYRFQHLKNVTGDEWTYIGDEFQRRTEQGKQTVVCLHGRPLPLARVSRGIARARKTKSRSTAQSSALRGPGHLAGRISFRTPSPTPVNSQSLGTIPDADFPLECPAQPSSLPEISHQMLEGSGLGPLPVFTSGRAHEDIQTATAGPVFEEDHFPGSFVWNTSIGHLENSVMELSDWVVAVDSDFGPTAATPSSFMPGHLQFASAVEFRSDPSRSFDLMRNLPFFCLLSVIEQQGLSLPGPVAVHGDILPHLAPPSSHPIMAIADAFRLAWAPAAVDLPNVASQLQLYVPERLEDGISGLFLKNLGILSSVTGGLPLIFALVSFLASNNHMTDRMMDDFLRWVVGQKYTSFLKRFLEIRTPTVQAFADVLLDSAVGSKNIQVVDMLLEYGVEFDNVLLCNIARIGDADLTQRVLCKANQACFKLDIGAKLLCQCIWHGQLDLVRFLLKKGVSPDAESGHMSALETAMLRNSIEAIKILLEAGADPNRRSFGSQTTPMEYAALNGRTEAVKCLLAHGAHVPEISSRFHGLTVLEWAALNRRDIFELFKQNLPVGAGGSLLADLVDAASSGPDAFRAYIEGQPEGVTTHQLERALEASIRSDRILAAATLLQYGVDPNGPTLAIPPLTTASTVDDNERCRLFLKLLILHKADPSGQPGLLESLAERLKDQSFWDAFPAYLVDSKQRMNALVKSARNGNIAAAACLLKSGLDIDTPVLCEKDRTMYPSVWLNPLQMAARSGREDMVLFLVGKGANINAPAHPIDGRTALQAALEGNTGDSHVRVAQLLLRLGADASAAPALLGGLTTLEAYLGQRLFEPQETEVVEEFCDKLLDAGASVSRPGGEPSWALHEVVSRGWHKALARFLRETPIIDHMWRDKVVSFTTCTPTQLACLLGDLTALRMLLDHGASVNEAPAYSRGRTALQAAALLTPRVEKMTIVHLLLSRGADINAEPSPEYGITALQGAAIAGDLKLAELLISLGADVNAWPSVKDGRTAIEGAAEHGRLDMVRLLLNAGAIGDVIRGTGLERAIELAEDNGYFAVANLLKMENLSR